MVAWRFLDSGYADGATNMAIDEAVMRLHAAGESPPTLRFYRWRPPCLSIGYAQSMAKEIDQERCREWGIDWVRRPTGGRAILHDKELTYSLVASADDPLVSGGIIESYRKISQGMIFGLRRLGVEAQVVEPASVGRSSALKTAACFDSPSHYEVTVKGGKILGSAQVRSQGVILQHGSLLLQAEAERLFALFRLPSEKVRQKLAEEFAQQVIGLWEALGRSVAFAEVAEAMRAGFAKAFQIDLQSGELSPAEQALARQLREGKYATVQWNLQR